MGLCICCVSLLSCSDVGSPYALAHGTGLRIEESEGLELGQELNCRQKTWNCCCEGDLLCQCSHNRPLDKKGCWIFTASISVISVLAYLSLEYWSRSSGNDDDGG